MIDFVLVFGCVLGALAAGQDVRAGSVVAADAGEAGGGGCPSGVLVAGVAAQARLAHSLAMP